MNMTQQLRHLTLSSLVLLLVGACVWAQGEAPMVQIMPLSSFKGSVADETKMTVVASPIIDTATLHTLWTSWGIADAEPVVDFTKQLVVFSTTRGNFLYSNLGLDGGNLRVGGTATLDVLPGFRYVIDVIDRGTILSVNGTALPPAPMDSQVPILLNTSATYSALTERRFQVITSEKEWLGPHGAPLPVDTAIPMDGAAIPVNFDTQMLILCAMGQQATGGYHIAITDVRETAQRITVTVKETRPAPNAMTTDALTQPYAIAVIAKNDRPVYFDLGAASGTIVPIISTITNIDSLQKAATTAVIKDVAAWKELYDKQMPPGTPLPNVNFGENMALVLFVGPTLQGVAVTSAVTERGGQLQVAYTVTPDFPIYSSRACYPWAAVIVPKSDLPVTFTQALPAR
jgi:hypothetical protein